MISLNLKLKFQVEYIDKTKIEFYFVEKPKPQFSIYLVAVPVVCVMVVFVSILAIVCYGHKRNARKSKFVSVFASLYTDNITTVNQHIFQMLLIYVIYYSLINFYVSYLNFIDTKLDWFPVCFLTSQPYLI